MRDATSNRVRGASDALSRYVRGEITAAEYLIEIRKEVRAAIAREHWRQTR